MSKSLFKLLIAIVVLVASHSIFWFFKAGQIEKHINNFVFNNSSNFSTSSFDVSGFPLMHIVTLRDVKFTIPNSSLNKNRVALKKVEAKSKVFNNVFSIEIVGGASVIDKLGNVNEVQFKSQPKISLSTKGDKISHFSYQDQGYKIENAQKKILYQADSAQINFDSQINDAAKTISKVKIDIKQMVGFDVVSIYKNVFERKIIDRIKTGEISLGSSVVSNFVEEKFALENNIPQEQIEQEKMAQSDDGGAVAAVAEETTQPATIADVTAATDSQEIAAEPSPTSPAQDSQAAQNAAPAVIATTDAEIAQSPEAAMTDENPTAEATNTQENPVNETPDEPQNLFAEKNDLLIDLEYYLTPNSESDEISLPLDQGQLQNVQLDFNKIFIINKIEIKNSSYSISISGRAHYFQDDVTPSGSIAVKVENIDNLIGFIRKNIEKIASDNSSKLESFDASNTNELSQDSYSEFLRKISLNLEFVSLEIASKNKLTTPEVAVFEIRREKNLDFITNETPMREILGKF